MLDTVVISDNYVFCSVVFGALVGVFVFNMIWSELLITSVISCPLWSSVYKCQRVECAFTSPMRNECGMFVMYYMQCCMFVSAVLECMDVLSRGGNKMFAIVICLVLLLCTLTISSSVLVY